MIANHDYKVPFTAELSIICVNWNSLDYLRSCLASIYEHTRTIPFEVIVVDNASVNDSIDDLKEQFPNITIIKNKVNRGFASANNTGFLQSVGKYVLFLNPDTRLCNAAIDIMWEHIKLLKHAGVVGCRILNADLSVQLTSIQKLPTVMNQVFDLEYLQLRWPRCPLWSLSPLFSANLNPVEVEAISGACMLLRREVFEQVGMFSNDYFMYAEDIDLNYKTKRAGFTNYYVAEASIVHYGGGSSSRQTVEYWSTIMKYRAMRRLFEKIRGPLYGSLYRVAIGLAAVARLMALALAYPFANILWKKDRLQSAAAKWRVILGWAMGYKRSGTGRLVGGQEK
jgi:GT2 family glycosyltransferase